MAQYRQMQPDLRTHLHVSTGYRVPPYKAARIRRAGKSHHHRRPPIIVVTVSVALFLAFLVFRRYTGRELKSHTEFVEGSNQTEFSFSRELRFGQGSRSGRDSRYWDRDDRRRDQDYTEEESPKPPAGGENMNTGNIENAKGVLYNEGARSELNSYKEEYESSLKNGVDPDDEYDDGIDTQDDLAVSEREIELEIEREKEREKERAKERERDENNSEINKIGNHKEKGNGKKGGSKKKPKRHKFSSSTCDMKFMNSTAQLVEPEPNNKFARFSLDYSKTEQRQNDSASLKPRFAGHQSWEEREDSYYARDQKINCGFVRGTDGSSTGFDVSENDMKYMSRCHVAVSSCIFGNSDRLRSPFGKTITRLSRKNVCFAMFLDEETLQTLLLEGQQMDEMGFIGLWKTIVVRNMPYEDMRRVGKIPKFLAHRLFPSARYSIWLDSKLRLQSDPLLILEYFLWRNGYEYAISNHYDRHCVWEEVAQNKKLNKFNHTIIDQQFEFYQSDGLKRFDPSDPNKLLPSYVPEGSFIVREHTPMSNLFSCLWFNEVDRFTPRDQLSFAYTFLKLTRMNPTKPFYLNMFKDCERRSIAKLFHHRAEEKHTTPSEMTR